MKKKFIPITFIILFSIILWGAVTLSGDFTSTIRVKVQVVESPKNFALGKISHKEIYLRVKAKGWELAKLGLGGEREFVVSAHRRIGRSRIDLRKEVENNPWLVSSFHLVEMAPTHIEINIDKTISKVVKVKQNIEIEFKPGYGIASDIKIIPEEVEIFGAASILQNIDSLNTEPEQLQNVDDRVEMDLAFQEINGVLLTVKNCRLEFDVQKIVDKSFDELPVEIRNVPPSKELILFPGKISVVLKGGINKLGRLTNDSVKAFVDFWEIQKHEEEQIEPVIEIPPFTTLIDVKPKKLEYIIKQY